MGEHNHPVITMSSIPMAEHMVHIRRDDWAPAAELVLRSAGIVAQAGARFAICPDNTLHQAIDLIVDRSPIPWLHIAQVVAAEARSRGFRHVGVLGTRYLTEGPVYRTALAAADISMQIPGAEERERVNTIIFKELVNDIRRDESRRYLYDRIRELRDRGCDAVVLGCTELPLVVFPEDSPLPPLDSTRLLAKAALRQALLPEAGSGGAAAGSSH
jgi:aspartate racemase